MNNRYVKTRNWQIFLRKRIERLLKQGWHPAEISVCFGIPKSLVDYHCEFIDIDRVIIKEFMG